MLLQKALDEVRDGDVIVLVNTAVARIRKGHITWKRIVDELRSSCRKLRLRAVL